MQEKQTDFFLVLDVLAKNDVNFIITGGVSAVLQGAPVTTFDLDILHERSDENVRKLLRALKELNAYYRVRKDIRIEPDLVGLVGKGHHLLLTDAGPLDILGTIGEGNSFHQIISDVNLFEIEGKTIRVQSLESLLQTKKEVGREKDLLHIPILQRTIEENQKMEFD